MHLAQLNVGRLVAPTSDPRVASFMANLDRINGLGARMPGFVWRMGSDAPGVDEALARLADLRAHGPSPRAFGWADLPAARLWRTKACGRAAA